MKEESIHFSEVEEKILNATLKVVNEATISGTRMHLIADKADMVQSNLHYYYKTKQELLEGLQERVLEEFYKIRRVDKKKCADTLKDQLHIFFHQKKHMLTKKRDYDFAELNFIVESKVNKKIQERFLESYSEWRDAIREIIIRFCPNMSESDKEIIPYLAVSLLEGASLQALIDGKEFDADAYFEAAEETVLNQIENAMKKCEGNGK